MSVENLESDKWYDFSPPISFEGRKFSRVICEGTHPAEGGLRYSLKGVDTDERVYSVFTIHIEYIKRNHARVMEFSTPKCPHCESIKVYPEKPGTWDKKFRCGTCWKTFEETK